MMKGTINETNKIDKNKTEGKNHICSHEKCAKIPFFVPNKLSI